MMRNPSDYEHIARANARLALIQASRRVAHVLFWCLCGYCVLVFLCYWEFLNQTRLD